jgi:hypothetical protein
MNKEIDQSEVKEEIVPDVENTDAFQQENAAVIEPAQHPIEQEESPTVEELNLDFTGFSKEKLVAFLKDLFKESNIHKVDEALKAVKAFYDELHQTEKKEALEKFLADGGTEMDFELRLDEFDIAFDANYKLLKDKRNQYFKALEEKKGDNLHKKEEVLEKLRAFVDAEETNISFDTFKKIQEEWKAIGNVPAAQAKTLWANYKALVDRFYDNRSIYFELKELDRRKNLESKLELCIRAEKLNGNSVVKDAVRELNELHHEFKHIGPVPADEQEAVWQRFKAASDAIYARRDAFVEVLQKELQENLQKKSALVEEINKLTTFNSDRIKEWNQKTKELLQLQKNWEAVGAVPRNKAKEINKKFWTAFKSFFANKSSFFKKLDAARDANLKLKRELIEKAELLKVSTDWERTANQFKDLQNKWKLIGPVPEKLREKVYAEFKAACDYFFEQRRSKQEEKEQDYNEHLKHKESIIAELKQLAETNTGTPEKFKALVAAFEAEGYVPKKSITSIRHEFNQAVNVFMNSLSNLSSDEKNKLQMEIKLQGLKGDPQAQQKIYQQEQIIRKKISKIEADLAVWRNNLEFFANSRNADKFKAEFNEKIDSASAQLDQLKQQLKILRAAS